ncbi:MAG: site-specific integrase [Bryobacteraceae bacterium]|nr:site-specific integrase [Bryobacteraceae bacterium]
MLTVYRRHRPDCRHKAKGRAFLRCSCPLWCDGELDGRRFRRSLRTRSLEEAQTRIRMLEAGGLTAQPAGPEPGVEDLARAFLADARARQLKPSTIGKYEGLFRDMLRFAEQHETRQLSRWTPAVVRDFRETWRWQRLAAVKQLERLKTVFRFAVEQGWLSSSPAAGIRPPRVSLTPTLPFSEEEMRRILAACDRFPGKGSQLRALVLLMRYSGLRIMDAVTLARDRIRDGKLFLYTQKTGTPVWVPLPPVVLRALEAFEPESARHFFWTGTSRPDAAARVWSNKLRKIFLRAGLPDGHSHRFRDTFAVRLLENGVSLEVVSVLLGHQSIRVTEKHYAPWVQERQARLEEAVRRAWDGMGETPRVVAMGGQ